MKPATTGSPHERLDALPAQVLDSVGGEDERLRELIAGIVTHLHAFVRETRPTEAEWLRAVDFLVRTGHACTDRRNEFILLSDMLGLTSAVDEVNHTGPPTMTPSSVEGPFHSPAPPRPMGAWIAEGPERDRGEAAVVHGRVTDCDGRPLPGAVLDIWQADDAGLYDSQDAAQPEGNLRALLTTGEDGSYWFRTVRPSSYPVPTDGPVGELLRALGRHPMRPAHVHIRVEAAGHRPLTTHIFVDGDPYLGSDAAFAVKDALVAPFRPCDDPAAADRFEMKGPFLEAEFDIRLVAHDVRPVAEGEAR
ncbi:dioxygenase family protein [Planobispora takensis]|uniref:6-chlorohydroxyquinol-1,2-dioxygenase n=1 Tax=Planobispora takensis TaxID=1367882 RepID=A0A8J3WW48_9ACTN|nr:dioxygenase [Planobispora takensis]GII01537.1 6-chlorohydroxyquinol-1,2-dioxygenase [Planobispora takensis]